MNKIINKAPIIGFVRYSQKIKFANNKKEKNVFEEEYFEYRYEIFKNITLKSFQQQTNHNFVLLLLHSESMPEQYKKRFVILENENSFLYNVFMKDGMDSFQNILMESKNYVEFKDDVSISFRVDNDDAIQNDFIEKLHGFLKKDFVGFTVNAPQMYRVKHITNQSFLLEEFYFPANAIGLAYITNRENYKTIMQLGDHDLVNDKNKIILLPKSENAGLMTINGKNEINSIDNTKAQLFNKEDLYKYLEKNKFGNIDLDYLKILGEENNFSKFSSIITLRSFVPPILLILLRKIRFLLNRNN